MTTPSNVAVPMRSPDELVAARGLLDRLRESVSGIVSDIVSTTAPNRDDRLWPADLMVYQTNPLSLAYGACGAALFLQQASGGIPADAEAWILGRPLSTSTYPPGLYVGLAGIALAFARMGRLDRAEEALNLAYKSPLLFDDLGLTNGMAGWGLASLSMFAHTGNQTHLDYAVTAGERLLAAAKVDGGGRSWPTPSGTVPLGHANGASGIACYFLRLFETTGDERFRSVAIEAMDLALRHAYRNGPKSQWPSHVGSRILLPYWKNGSAGIGVGLLRFYGSLHDDRYLAEARRTAAGLTMLFAAVPGQFDGMSGVGDFLIDLYNVTGEDQYYQQALGLAESILCYQVDTPRGKAFPGRALLRLSTDYSTGSAGIGSFLQRILDPALPSLDGRLYSGRL